MIQISEVFLGYRQVFIESGEHKSNTFPVNMGVPREGVPSATCYHISQCFPINED